LTRPPPAAYSPRSPSSETVASRQEGLDATAHAKVQRGARAAPNGQAVEGHSGGIGSEDVVRLHDRLLRIRRVVGEDEVVMDGQAHAGANSPRSALEKAGRVLRLQERYSRLA
jgi:hypothetical protein